MTFWKISNFSLEKENRWGSLQSNIKLFKYHLLGNWGTWDWSTTLIIRWVSGEIQPRSPYIRTTGLINRALFYTGSIQLVCRGTFKFICHSIYIMDFFLYRIFCMKNLTTKECIKIKKEKINIITDQSLWIIVKKMLSCVYSN